MDPNREMLNDIYKMTRENNQMLHAMRRHAFIGGVLKFLIWMIFLLAPIWFYMTYLNSSVQSMLKAFTQMQASGANAQAQFTAFQNSIKELQAKIPGMSSASSSKQ